MKWEIEVNGQRFEVEAPTQEAAVEAARRFAGQQQAAPAANEPGPQMMDPDPGAAGYAMDGPSPVIQTPPTLEGDGRNWLDNAVGHLDAGMNTLTLGAWPWVRAGMMDLFSDQSIGEIIPSIYENMDATRQDSPWTIGAAEAGGAMVPALFSAGATLPVSAAQMAGRSAPPIIETLGRAATLGGGGAATFGFADTLGRTGGDTEAAADAAWDAGQVGGAVGLGIPLIAGLPSMLRNVRTATADRAANRMIDDALAETGESRQGIAAQMARNPDLMPLDVNPSLLNRAQGIAAQPGAGQATMTGALRRRVDESAATVRNAIEGTLGAPPDAAVLLGGINDRARAVGGQFDQLWPTARPADVNPAVAAIDDQLRPGWQYSNTLTPEETALVALRERLTGQGGEMLTGASALHQMQSTLGRTIQNLFNGSGADVNMAQALMPVREAIRDSIDAATNGAYRPIQSQYADVMDTQRALEQGMRILDNPRSGPAGLQARPEMWREWIAGLSEPEREAARLGALLRIDNEIGAARNATRSGMAVPEVEFNRERLALLFSPEEVNALHQQMTDLRQMLSNTNAILGNSQTAQRQLAQQATGVREVGGSGIGLGGLALGAAGASNYVPNMGLMPAAALATAAGTRRAVDSFRRSTDLARNAAAARQLTQQGPSGAQAFTGSSVPMLPGYPPLMELPPLLALTAPALAADQIPMLAR